MTKLQAAFYGVVLWIVIGVAAYDLGITLTFGASVAFGWIGVFAIALCAENAFSSHPSWGP